MTITIVVYLAILVKISIESSKGWFPLIFPILVFAFIVSTLLSGRTLTSEMSALFSDTQDELSTGAMVWINRVITVLVLAISFERVFRFIFVKSSRQISNTYLFWTFLAFALGNVFLNGIFGTRPEFSHRAIYPVLAMLAAFFIAKSDATRVVNIVRTSLFVFLIISAIVLVAKPTLVLQTNYIGILPGFHYRYWGLSAHANSMGPLAVVFLLCLWLEPFKRSSVNKFAWILGMTSLLITQSKTSLSLALVCIVIVAFTWIKTASSQNVRQRNANLVFMVIGLILFVLSMISIFLIFTDVGRTLDLYFGSKQGAELLSLTGRDRIWEIAVNEWHHNIWFGYGPAMWDVVYRMQIGMNYAFHAHNQFYQSLGNAGLIGVFTLFIYLIALTVAAIRSAKASKGLSLALLSLLLIESITEVPLGLNDVLSHDFFVQLLTYIICAGYTVQPNEEQLKVSEVDQLSKEMRSHHIE
jgi:exopolysaccharide production protein ExoQ